MTMMMIEDSRLACMNETPEAGGRKSRTEDKYMYEDRYDAD